MKKAILALLVLAMASPAWTQEAGDFGAGVILGEPIGGTVKYWTSGSQALDLGIGADDGTVLYGDYLWHGWDIFPQPKQGRLGGYVGAGPQLEVENDSESEFGIRAIVGLDYWVSRHPIELFMEGGPVFRLTPSGEVDGDIGLGVRFYFTYTEVRSAPRKNG